MTDYDLLSGLSKEAKQDLALTALQTIFEALSDGSQVVIGPLTDSQLRAAPVSVNTGLVQALTDAQVRATPLPVSVATGTVSVSNIAALTVDNALNVTGYNLQAASYSGTTAQTVDYLLSRLAVKFSTSEMRTITVYSAIGAVRVS